MFKRLWQRLSHQASAVLFGIVLISSLCVVPSEAAVVDSFGDGMNVITWDGDTTGKEVSSGGYVRVADYVSTDSAFACIEFGGEELVVDGFIQLEVPFDAWCLSIEGTLFVISTSEDLTGSSYATVPAGTWVMNLGADGATYYIVYPASSGGVEPPPDEGGFNDLDFSKTSLRVFDSNVLGTKADWACRWYGVPNLDPPDNVYYFFEFSASSAGHNVSSVPFFMGSNEICPDGEYEFFIENLLPSTTYTGVLKLVYNTTGEWSGFTDTGVTYSFSFTTAESDPVPPDEPDVPVVPDEPDVPGGDSGGGAGDGQDVIGVIKDSNKEVIDAIQDSSAADREWMDEQYSSGVGSLPDDTADFNGLVGNLDANEEAYKNEAFARFQELSSSFNGFDGSVRSGISLAGTLFSRFFSALGSYKIVYTFPLLLAVAFVVIGRLGRSSFKHERSDHDQFLIDGW